MKKNFLKVFVAAAALALMTACSGGLDGKISDFEKAVDAENWEKAAQIAIDLDKNYKEADFSEEQKARLEKAAEKAGYNLLPYLINVEE